MEQHNEIIQEYSSKYSFKLDNWQLKAAEKIITSQENVLVCAPTASGKTIVAEAAIFDALYKGKKVLYTAPVKAISNQLFNEFKTKFKEHTIGILTGDNKFNPSAQIVLLTTEILRNLLYQPDNENIDIYEDVADIIFDEVHYIADEDRGGVWEECFILLPNHINLVMLSATLENPSKFQIWLNNIKEKKTHLFTLDKRVVPLRHTMLIFGSCKKDCDSSLKKLMNKYDGKLHTILDEDKQFNENTLNNCIRLKKKFQKITGKRSGNPVGIINKSIELLQKRELFPALYFSFSRKQCDKFASKVNIILNSPLEQNLVEKFVYSRLRLLENNYQNIEQFQIYYPLWIKGIAVHHSGLLPIFKEMVELLCGHKNNEGNPQPLIKALFATETVAIGINLPFKTILITDLMKFDNHGKRYLKAHEYIQICGRGGRRGFDNYGLIIQLINLFRIPEHHDMKGIMLGRKQKIESKFDLKFQLILKILCSKISNIREILSKSLLNKEFVGYINDIKTKLDELDFNFHDVNKEIFLEMFYLEDDLYNSDIPYGYRQRKIVDNKIDILKKKLPQAEINFYEKNKKKFKIKLNLDNDLQFYQTVISVELNKILSFLKEMDYITSDNINDLNTSHLTKKGIIASYISDCNEILMSELLIDGHFDELTSEDIAVLLTLFIEKNDSDIISTHYTNFIDVFKKLAIDMENEFSKRKIYSKYCWSINCELLDVTYDWVNGKSFSELNLPSFEGNFVNDMIKITSISRILEKVALILGKNQLAIKASKVESLVLKGVVSVDSLYIR